MRFEEKIDQLMIYQNGHTETDSFTMYDKLIASLLQKNLINSDKYDRLMVLYKLALHSPSGHSNEFRLFINILYKIVFKK